jgi:RNA polymerase sigma factor (sigma-70 family)
MDRLPWLTGASVAQQGQRLQAILNVAGGCCTAQRKMLARGVARRGASDSYTLKAGERLRPLSALRSRDVAEAKKALIERLFAAHGGALRALFYRRIRNRADAADLAQEVYVRMLRIPDPETIRDMEAYLFTVASNLAREYAAREGRRGTSVHLEEGAVPDELMETAAVDAQIDTAQQVQRLRELLRELPPRWHAAIVMQYVQGLSQAEIADRLGVSVSMVKKYLGKALGRCRGRMTQQG